MQAFGAPQHVIDAELGSLPADDGLTMLWPRHWQAVQAFCLAATQWRVSARTQVAGQTAITIPHHVGIDYAAADVAWRRSGLELDEQGFADLRTLEHHARDLLNGKKPSELQPL